MELIYGSVFVFALISNDLKAIMRTDQAGITWCIIAGVSGMTLGQPLAGALFDSDRYGPRVVAQVSTHTHTHIFLLPSPLCL